jgi:cell division protease FtsH
MGARRKAGLPREFEQPRAALAEAMLRATVPTGLWRRLAEGKRQTALVIVAEDPAVLGALEAVADSYWGEDVKTLVRDSVKKARDPEPLRWLSRGSTVYICGRPEHVPSDFLRMADQILTISPISPAMVARAIRKCCKGRVGTKLDGLDMADVGFELVCAAIVHGGSATRVARTLSRLCAGTQAALEDRELPDLADCVEYGPARDWGLQVATDIAAWRAGRLPASDLSTAVLLTSPPGFGKTFFCRVLSRTLGVRLIRFSVGELFEGDGYLNTTLKSLDAVFARAKAAAPCILLLDEVDSFPVRGSGGRNDGYFSAVVNHLLVLIDGIGSRTAGVVLVGATNRPDNIDPALRRPGRLDRTIEIGLPDAAGIEHILRVHLRDDLDGDDLGALCPLAKGSSPAAIALWVKTARQRARGQGRDLIVDDLRLVAQLADTRSEAEIERACIHEAGHAAVALALEEMDGTLAGVSVRRTPDSGGSTDFLTHEPSLMMAGRLDTRVRILLAGRAAEEVLLGPEASSGAGGGPGSDLDRASRTLAGMRGSYGMSGSLVWLGSPLEVEQLLVRDRDFRALVEADLQGRYKEVREIVIRHRAAIRAIALRLRRKLSLTGDEVRTIFLTAPSDDDPCSGDGDNRGEDRQAEANAGPTDRPKGGN